MALSSAAFLKEHVNLTQTMGENATNSDATLVIDGYEKFFIKVKSFPDPTGGISEPVVVPLPLGNETNKPAQAKTSFSGSATFIETEDRAIEKMLTQIKKDGGYFDAWIYHGTPDKYVNRKRIKHCFVTMQPAQRDFQSNTEVYLLEGEITGNYFGEIEKGNIETLMGGY